MKNKLISRTAITLLAVLTAGCCGIGAILFNADKKTDNFIGGECRVLLEDTGNVSGPYSAGQVIPRTIQASNTGNVDCYVSFVIEVPNPADRELCQIDFNTTDYFELDGRYFYEQPLKVGQKVPPIMTNITISDTAVIPDNFDPDLIVYTEAIPVPDDIKNGDVIWNTKDGVLKADDFGSLYYEGNPHIHQWKHIAIPATPEKNGEEYDECEICGEIKNRIIDVWG